MKANQDYYSRHDGDGTDIVATICFVDDNNNCFCKMGRRNLMNYYNELEIVAIELDNSGQKPIVVYTYKEGRYTEWEFEYSKKNDWYYYYCIGDHPICYYIHKEPILFDSTKYWISNKLDTPVIEKGDCEKIEMLPFSIDKLFPKKAEIDGPPDWCKICKDWFPWDDYCKHLWWDDNKGLQFNVVEMRGS